jgi:hypothetical protein
MKKPATVSGAGIYEISDNPNMHLICPTRQVPKQNRFKPARSDIESEVVEPRAAQAVEDFSAALTILSAACCAFVSMC